MTESRLRRRGDKRRGATGATPGEAAAAGEKADAYLPVDLVPLLLYLNLEKEELGHAAAGEEDHPSPPPLDRPGPRTSSLVVGCAPTPTSVRRAAAAQQPLIRRLCAAPTSL
jgi:hypothetical protein